MVNSLIKTTRRLSWRGICERYANETQEARIKRFILLLYGEEILAQRVTDLLVKKGIL